MPGAAGVGAAGADAPVPAAALSLFSSLMFFDSSATRLLLSCAWRACATFSVGGAGGGTALRDGELVRCAGRGIAIVDVGLQLA
jgi:hypothetical protein